MIFAREKRSIGRLFSVRPARYAGRFNWKVQAALTGPPLARTSEIIVRTTLTRTFGAISTSISGWSSDGLGRPARRGRRW